MNTTLDHSAPVAAPPRIEMREGAAPIVLTATPVERVVAAFFLLLGVSVWAIAATLALAIVRGRPEIAASLPAAFRHYAELQAPPLVLLALVVAFAVWSIHGVVLSARLLRRVAGRDVIELRPDEVACWKSVAFAGIEWVFARAQIIGVALRNRDRALMLRTVDARTWVVTKLGTLDERLRLEREIRERYVPRTSSTPDEVDPSDLARWEVERCSGGFVIRNSLKSRVVMNLLATFVVLLVELFAVMPMVAGVMNDVPGSITFGRIFVALAAAALLVGVYGLRQWWIVRENELLHGRAFGNWKKEEKFTNARLTLGSRQQKNRTLYHLACSDREETGKPRRSTRLGVANDLCSIKALATLVSRTTGWPVDETIPR